MRYKKRVQTQRISPGIVLILASFLLLGTGQVQAGHQLAASGLSCTTCHAVGGANDLVVANTRLIKKDSRLLEILNGGWSTGTT